MADPRIKQIKIQSGVVKRYINYLKKTLKVRYLRIFITGFMSE